MVKPFSFKLLNLFPWDRLSTTVTPCPEVMRCPTKWLPINPAPPVIID